MKYICLSVFLTMVRNFPQIDRGKSAEPMPFDCEPIVDSGLGWLISMEK